MPRPPRSAVALSPDGIAAWNEVLDAAEAFRDLAPWKWIDGECLLGVRDPGSGEIDWCSVMGQQKEVFGAAIHPGDAGLASLERLLENGPDEFDAHIQQHVLVLSSTTAPTSLPLWARCSPPASAAIAAGTPGPSCCSTSPDTSPFLPPGSPASGARPTPCACSPACAARPARIPVGRSTLTRIGRGWRSRDRMARSAPSAWTCPNPSRSRHRPWPSMPAPSPG